MFLTGVKRRLTLPLVYVFFASSVTAETSGSLSDLVPGKAQGSISTTNLVSCDFQDDCYWKNKNSTAMPRWSTKNESSTNGSYASLNFSGFKNFARSELTTWLWLHQEINKTCWLRFVYFVGNHSNCELNVVQTYFSGATLCLWKSSPRDILPERPDNLSDWNNVHLDWPTTSVAEVRIDCCTDRYQIYFRGQQMTKAGLPCDTQFNEINVGYIKYDVSNSSTAAPRAKQSTPSLVNKFDKPVLLIRWRMAPSPCQGVYNVSVICKLSRSVVAAVEKVHHNVSLAVSACSTLDHDQADLCTRYKQLFGVTWVPERRSVIAGYKPPMITSPCKGYCAQSAQPGYAQIYLQFGCFESGQHRCTQTINGVEMNTEAFIMRPTRIDRTITGKHISYDVGTASKPVEAMMGSNFAIGCRMFTPIPITWKWSVKNFVKQKWSPYSGGFTANHVAHSKHCGQPWESEVRHFVAKSELIEMTFYRCQATGVFMGKTYKFKQYIAVRNETVHDRVYTYTVIIILVFLLLITHGCLLSHLEIDRHRSLHRMLQFLRDQNRDRPLSSQELASPPAADHEDTMQMSHDTAWRNALARMATQFHGSRATPGSVHFLVSDESDGHLRRQVSRITGREGSEVDFVSRLHSSLDIPGAEEMSHNAERTHSTALVPTTGSATTRRSVSFLVPDGLVSRVRSRFFSSSDVTGANEVSLNRERGESVDGGNVPGEGPGERVDGDDIVHPGVPPPSSTAPPQPESS